MVSMNAMFASVRNSNINQMLDSLGLPQSVAQTLGQAVNTQGAGFQAAAVNLVSMTAGMSQSQLESVFGQRLPPGQYIPKPFSMMQGNRRLFGHNFHSVHNVFDPSKRLGGLGQRGAMVARSVDHMTYSNVQARMYMEQRLGGQIVADGRMDMRITVQRYQPYTYAVPYSQEVARSPQQSGMYGALAQLEKNILGVAGQLVRGGANSGSWSLNDPHMSQIAKQMNIKPPIAFEDLLFLNMMTYAKKKEGQIMGTMDQLVRNVPNPQGGLPGAMNTAGPYNNTAFGGLVGGPVGGGMGGGSLFGGLPAGTAAQSMFGQGGAQYMGYPAGATAGAAGGAAGPYNPFDSKQSDTTRQAMLQKMMQDLQRMYTMISNVQKSMHDMGMAAIRNIR